MSEESSQQEVQKVLFLLRKMHKGVKRTSVVSSQSNAVSEESSQQQVQKVLFLLRKMHEGCFRELSVRFSLSADFDIFFSFPNSDFHFFIFLFGPFCLKAWVVRHRSQCKYFFSIGSRPCNGKPCLCLDSCLHSQGR